MSSHTAMEAIASKRTKFMFCWVDLDCCSTASSHTLVSKIRGLPTYYSFIDVIWMNLLPYAGALDVSAEKGEDVTSSCAGFKDLSHQLKGRHNNSRVATTHLPRLRM